MELIFTAYNRPEYFEHVGRSWAAVRGIEDIQTTVYLEPSLVQAEMTGLALDWLPKVMVKRNPFRYGVLENPFRALNDAFTRSEFVILAEDDVVVSDDILEYFDYAASTFRAHHVLAVCACTYNGGCAADDQNRVELTQQFNPLVWGTWHDRWTDVLRDTWDHDYTSGTREHPESGWDWNLNLRVMQDWQIVSPLSSRSTHIGKYRGTHTTVFSFPGSVAKTWAAHREAAPFELGSRR